MGLPLWPQGWWPAPRMGIGSGRPCRARGERGRELRKGSGSAALSFAGDFQPFMRAEPTQHIDAARAHLRLSKARYLVRLFAEHHDVLSCRRLAFRRVLAGEADQGQNSKHALLAFADYKSSY